MKKKLKLSEFKIKSFVTQLNDAEAKTVQGGNITNGQCTNNAACINTHPQFCLHTCGHDVPGLPNCVCPPPDGSAIC
jgi:hypothetical protein